MDTDHGIGIKNTFLKFQTDYFNLLKIIFEVQVSFNKFEEQ